MLITMLFHINIQFQNKNNSHKISRQHFPRKHKLNNLCVTSLKGKHDSRRCHQTR